MTIESISEYRERAGTWLEFVGLPTDGRKRRKPGERASSRSSSSTMPPIEEELELLGAYRAWHQEKLAAGFGAIAVSTEWGGLGLSPGHDAAFKELESGVRSASRSRGHLGDEQAHRTDDRGVRHRRNSAGVGAGRSSNSRSSAASCSPNPAPGATSPVWRARPSATATNGCSTVRRCGRRPPESRDTGSRSARTDPEVPKHAGLTAFIVPLDAAGIEIRPIRQMSGGASFNEVFLSGVRLSDDMRIGAVGAGWKVALAVLGHERSSSGSGRRGGDSTSW